MRIRNKGFSLVEIIIVIAILGVLMAVLVPQYIQYVEKSRAGVCSANREILLREMKVGVLSEHYKDMQTAYEKLFGEEGTRKADLLAACPSGGTVSWNKEQKLFLCSKHGGDDDTEDGEEETPPPENTTKPDSPEGFGGSFTEWLDSEIKRLTGEETGYLKDYSISLDNNGKFEVYDENGQKINIKGNIQQKDFLDSIGGKIDGNTVKNVEVFFEEKGDNLYSTKVVKYSFYIGKNKYVYDAIKKEYIGEEPPKTN